MGETGQEHEQAEAQGEEGVLQTGAQTLHGVSLAIAGSRQMGS
jgi:hypothetical protein